MEETDLLQKVSVKWKKSVFMFLNKSLLYTYYIYYVSRDSRPKILVPNYYFNFERMQDFLFCHLVKCDHPIFLLEKKNVVN